MPTAIDHTVWERFYTQQAGGLVESAALANSRPLGKADGETGGGESLTVM